MDPFKGTFSIDTLQHPSDEALRAERLRADELREELVGQPTSEIFWVLRV